jgi:regulator of protease activity HflC (stomatin/prohibitin superfamily)
MTPNSPFDSAARKWTARIYFTCGLIALALYAVSGVTFVQPSEIAVVYRLGKVVGGDGPGAVRRAGLLWAFPGPIDRVVRLPSQRELSFAVNQFDSEQTEDEDGEIQSNDVTRYILTGDENLIGMQCVVRYTIENPVEYLQCSESCSLLIEKFVARTIQELIATVSLDEALQLRIDSFASESISRAAADMPVAAQSILESLPTDNTWSRSALRKELEAELSNDQADQAMRELVPYATTQDFAGLVLSRAQSRVAGAKCGVVLVGIEVHHIHPPRELVRTFESFQTARIEQETMKSRSQALADEVSMDTLSIAQQTIAEAKGRAEIIQAEAAVEISHFEADLALTRTSSLAALEERLRQESLAQILNSAARVYLVPDAAGSDMRIVLPRRSAKK